MPIRVFLVEDIPRMQSLLGDLFASIPGFRLEGTERTEAEAYLWLHEHPGAWDLAVIDLVLQQGSGMAVISRCRQRNPDGRVVVFSSYATPGVTAHCLALGADAVFDKSDPMDFVEYCMQLSGAEMLSPGG